MTILNVTLAWDESYCVLSSDSVAIGGDPPAKAVVTESALEGERKTFIGDGTPPTARALFHFSKLLALPHLRLVCAGIGATECTGAFGQELQLTLPARTDIGDLMPAVPARLHQVAARYPGRPFGVALAGWWAERGRVAAALWNSDDGFTYHRLKGHTLHPALDPADENYLRVKAEWAGPAAYKPDVTREFHKQLCANQLRACRAGRLARGVLFGGPIAIAHVDADAITLRTFEEEEIAPRAVPTT